MNELLPRAFFDRPVEQVAPDLLGCVISCSGPEGSVAVRLTEVEAYSGTRDPASHAFNGKTARNAVMFGRPGHAYVYFTYGMHFCVNLVCLAEGIAAAVLLRGGDVVAGRALAQTRRGRPDDLARGPARLCQALGIDRSFDGTDICSSAGRLCVSAGEPVARSLIRVGPRTGVSRAKDVPGRFWIDGEPSVSPYRAHVARAPRG